ARGEDRKAGEKIRVLIIDGENNHDWRSTTPLMKKILQDCGRFTVDVATTPQKPPLPPKPPTASDSDLARSKEDLLKYADNYGGYRKLKDSFHPDLDKYDVVLSNYNGSPWPAKFEKALDERLHSGKIALVIVHAANNSFGGWKEYNQMIGMGWRANNF